MIRQFVATSYIVRDEKVLLIFHRKLNMWLPPGGHIDETEIPEEAAVREAKEETGLDIETIGEKEEALVKRVYSLTMPSFIQLEDIEEHQHIDLIFVARVVGGKIKQNKKETSGIRWFSLDDMKKEKVSELVRKQAEKAIKIFNKYQNK